jgi:hypothetical protein
VGWALYAVERVADLHYGGDRCEGLCSREERTIWLRADLHSAVLESTLRHELYHAWEFEAGAPHDAEERANFHSTVSEAFDHEFNAQGGLAALLALPVRPTVRRREVAHA